MEGTAMVEGLTPEQEAEAQRMFEVVKNAAEEDIWRICCLMAGKSDRQLLGRTEFEVRDHIARIGAKAIETALRERKKGGTKAAAACVPDATATPDLLAGARNRS